MLLANARQLTSLALVLHALDCAQQRRWLSLYFNIEVLDFVFGSIKVQLHTAAAYTAEAQALASVEFYFTGITKYRQLVRLAQLAAGHRACCWRDF